MAKKIIEQGKSLISSKTFWFNILFVLVSLAGLFGYSEFKPDERLVSFVATFGAVINIVLRVKTSEPITKLK